MGGDYLDLPVLERERLVFFIVQIELAHSEKQLVWVDAEKRGVKFFWGRPPTDSPLNAVGCSYGPVFTEQGSAALVQERGWEQGIQFSRNYKRSNKQSILVTMRSNKHPGHLSSTGEETPATATRRTWHPLRSQSCHV